ncbi:beta-lactamase family protein, partial [Candidatus Binatia bacterium]|nr:beta-lactamase family protein [Candidatus Binatia bacterium]
GASSRAAFVLLGRGMSCRTWLTGITIGVAFTLLGGCGDGGGGGGSAPSRYDFADVARETQAFVDGTPGIDGVGLAIVQRDRGIVFQQSFGAFGDDRVYLLASSSKMITAGVLLRLADQGLLDLDRPVADVVPWLRANPDVTPAQLISNSSGLVGLRPNPSYPPYLCQFIFNGGTLQDCGERIFTGTGDDEQVAPPDTEFRYGGGQWQVAGAVAEVASGKSWSALVRETYVEPCDVPSLGYNNHFVQFPGAQGTYPIDFAGDPSTLRPTDNPNMEGGAYANVADYAKLVLMHLRGGRCDGGRVLSEAAVRRMHTDRIASYGGTTGTAFEGYGFGWWVDRDRPSLTIDPGAYGAYAWIDEERGYGAFFALEANTGVGTELFVRLLPLVAGAIDAGT